MKPGLAVKIVTLCGFTILMTGFVAYKAGAFEGTSSGINAAADSPVKDSVHWVTPEMAPSTKSGPVFEPVTKDTSRPKQTQQQSDQKEQAPNQNAAPPGQNAAPPKSNHYMGGSKSKGVFTPQASDTSKPK